VALQIIGLGLLFIVIATAIDMSYALASGSIGRLLRRSSRLARGRRLVSGATYLALGASAAVTESV
jgi:threonine/homoserine/homoserine lactone efflux protein